MKIENIHIHGFGVWADQSWGPLSSGINVFCGDNETGKSTLMAFVRAMLFGFERRGSPRRYEPLKGGAHGGRLDLTVEGRPVRIERKPGRNVRGTVTVYDGEETGGEERLDKLLNGTTRTLYHNVFAFGLEELEHFHTLQENEIAQHISGAGLGIGAARWAAVQRDLEDRQSALFLSRGQTSVINVALRELDAVRDDLDRTEHQPEDYWAAHEGKTRLAAEIAGLEEAVVELKQRVHQYEKRVKSRPFRERRARLEARLEELPPVDRFPEGGVERLRLLDSRRAALNAEQFELQRDIERRRSRRIELAAMCDREDIARRSRVIDDLRSLAPRLDAVRRVRAAAVERLDATEAEKRALAASLERLSWPPLSWFLILLCVAWTGAGVAAWWGQAAVAAAIGVLSVAPILWYRRRSRTFAAVAAQARASAARLDSCATELAGIGDEARSIEEELRRRTGKTAITPEDISDRAAELERLQRISEELRRLDEASHRAEAESDRLRAQVQEAHAEIQALLDEAEAATEADFAGRAEIYKQRRLLAAELEKIPLDAPEPGLLFDIRAAEEEAYNAARLDLAASEQRLIEARHESGRIEERIIGMERSDERSRALARQESILGKIEGAAELWAILTLCRTMLDETRKVYETDRQPEVLRQASSFFKIMTEGRYNRVIAPLDGGDIQVERADGARLSPQMLSRGTAEQLYLAMRLALTREYASHMDPLPVLFDDVCVNFDPRRSRNTIRALRELALTHQVMVFTCHPHFVAELQEIVPTVHVFPLQ